MRGIGSSICMASLLFAACGSNAIGGNNNGTGTGNNNNAAPVCGDGIVDSGEQCDDGTANSDSTPDACRTDCHLAFCGDGVADIGEDCDDGGAAVVADDCPSTCVAPTCGDGHVWAGHEQCDDSNNVDEDGCSADCRIEGCVVFVSNDPAILLRDGLSWGTAFATVQEGLDEAQATGEPCEVWVAASTYHIFQGGPEDTVQLRAGVGLYGGFLGTEYLRGLRDWEANLTILQGSDSTDSTNVYHAVTGSDDATMDGFTILNSGQVLGRWDRVGPCGGGMYNDGSSPTVANCVFSANSAMNRAAMCNIDASPIVTNCVFSANSDRYGVGMANSGSSPTVTGCIFSGNSGGGMANSGSSPTVTGCVFSGNYRSRGGGMYNISSDPTVTNCIFSQNSAETGGGMYNDESSPTVTGCVFSGNSSIEEWPPHNYGGGGMVNANSSPVVSNCVFAGNSAVLHGGGMCNVFSSDPTIQNCTFSGNSAGTVGGGMHNYLSSPTVVNCIFWENSAGTGVAAINNYDATPFVFHSDIEGGYLGGAVIIDLDPGFLTAQTASGPWDSFTYDATLHQSLLQDTGAAWSPGELEGMFVQPDSSNPRWFTIVANTADTIRVWGDMTNILTMVNSYALYDLRLGAGSPCIDAGYGCSTMGGCDVPPWVPVTSATDLEGNGRQDAGLSLTNGGVGAPSFVDLGAYEYQP